MDWIPYCTGRYEKNFAKALAKRLRLSVVYEKVRLGAHVHEGGKTYCKIYVLRKELEELSC